MTDKLNLIQAKENARREYEWAQSEADVAYQIYAQEPDLEKQTKLLQTWASLRTKAQNLKSAMRRLEERVRNL